MKAFVSLSLMLGAAAVLAGCAEGPYVPAANPQSPEVAGAKVVLLDEALADVIAVDKPVLVERTKNNSLTVQVPLRNRSDETQSLQVQTVFRDSLGHVLYSVPGSETAWQSVVLSPNQLTYYSQTALSPLAVDYTVRIRLMDRHQD